MPEHTKKYAGTLLAHFAEVSCTRPMHTRYIPARLTKGKRWYISFYQTNPETEVLTRHRETSDLNRIKDKNLRLATALARIGDLNDNLLQRGYPYSLAPQLPPLTCAQAMDLAMADKKTDRHNSTRTYKTPYKHILHYLNGRGILHDTIKTFDKFHAYEVMDKVNRKGVGPRTYNNYRGLYVSLFNVLVQRGYLVQNPFSVIPKKKTAEKTRRTFTDYEKKIFIEKTRELYPDFLLVIYLLYYCFIRPGELRMLRIGDIQLKKDLILIPSHVSKNKKTEAVTIPRVLKPLLSDHISGFDPAKYLLGSSNGTYTMTPSFKPVGLRHLGRTHKIILGKCTTINAAGLSLYSWKDTGASAMAKHVNIVELQKQIRHAQLSTTQIYLSGFGVLSPSIKAYEEPIF